MAKNLLSAGYPVAVYDINENQMEGLAKAGARKTSSAGELAAQSDVVLTVLTWPKVVEEAVLGEGGVLAHMKKDATLIECSSIDHETSIRIAEKVEAAGRNFYAEMIRELREKIFQKEMDLEWLLSEEVQSDGFYFDGFGIDEDLSSMDTWDDDRLWRRFDTRRNYDEDILDDLD